MLYSQDQTWASEALERFLLKMTVIRERACTKIPYTTKNGKYDDNSTLAAEKEHGDRLVDQWFLGRYDVAAVSRDKRGTVC